MQFKVPQFLDIEDTIVFGLTWSQFAYCLGAAASVYISFRVTTSNILGFLIAFIPVTLFLSLAFVKINNRPFLYAFQNATNFFLKNNLYIWKNRSIKNETYESIINNIETRKKEAELRRIQKHKTGFDIKDIANSLDNR